MEDEGLSPGYRQQVVEFILQNTGGATATTGFDPNYVDPYTGGKLHSEREHPFFTYFMGSVSQAANNIWLPSWISHS